MSINSFRNSNCGVILHELHPSIINHWERHLFPVSETMGRLVRVRDDGIVWAYSFTRCWLLSPISLVVRLGLQSTGSFHIFQLELCIFERLVLHPCPSVQSMQSLTLTRKHVCTQWHIHSLAYSLVLSFVRSFVRSFTYSLILKDIKLMDTLDRPCLAMQWVTRPDLVCQRSTALCL